MARPEYVSVTQITTYLQCPRKYRFRYIDHVPPERKSVHLAFGSAVHSGISSFLEGKISGTVPELPVVLRTFRADWNAQLADDLLDLERREPGELATLGEQLVTLFAERFADEEVLSVDERVEAGLVDLRTGDLLPEPLVGFLDLSGEGWIGEVKTVSRKTSPWHWTLQLAAYSYAWRERTGVSPRVRVMQLTKTAEPKLHVEEVSVPLREEAWFVEVAGEVLAAVNNDTFFPNPTFLCAKCEYAKACGRTRST